PFFASTFMASNTSGEYPVPSRIKSKGPYFAEASVSESSFVLTYRAPSSSISFEFRYGGTVLPKVVTSRPRNVEPRWRAGRVFPIPGRRRAWASKREAAVGFGKLVRSLFER